MSDNVEISWKNSEGKVVSSSFPKERAEAIMSHLNKVVKDVKMKTPIKDTI
jgi:hypothetical protein